MFKRFLIAATRTAGVVIVLFIGLGILFKTTNPELGVGEIAGGFLTNPVVVGMALIFIVASGLLSLVRRDTAVDDEH